MKYVFKVKPCCFNPEHFSVIYLGDEEMTFVSPELTSYKQFDVPGNKYYSTFFAVYKDGKIDHVCEWRYKDDRVDRKRKEIKHEVIHCD
jgi:hypothetical protein